MAEQTTQNAETRGTGTNTMEMTGNSKLDARKAIMARADAGRQAEVEIDRESHDSVAAYDAAAETGTDTPNEEVRTVSEDALLRARGDEQVGEVDNGEQTGLPAGADTGSSVPEMVDLVVFGQSYQLPKDEVMARGGVAAVQMQLAADHRFRQATALAKAATEANNQAREKLAEAERLERSLRDRSSAAGATPSAQQQSGTTNPPVDEALRAKVKKTVDVMFQGDAEAVEKSLTEVLAAVPRGRETPPVDDIAALVLAKVEAKFFQTRASEAAAEAKAAQKLEVKQVNELVSSKYKEINDDPVSQAAMRGIFDQLRKDPKNQGRSLVSIADDAGALMTQRLHPELASSRGADVQTQMRTRTHMKRRLPQPSGASERAPAAEEESSYPTSGSDIVNMMRAARGQPLI
jgi:hypothetical protein